jgi:hypothetical protein
MASFKRKNFYPDFFSGAVFLFVIFAIPLTYYFGVARPQDIRKRAYQENKMLVLVRDYKSQDLMIDYFNEEIKKEEGMQDMRFDLDGNGVVNGIDHGLILQMYEGK